MPPSPCRSPPRPALLHVRRARQEGDRGVLPEGAGAVQQKAGGEDLAEIVQNAARGRNAERGKPEESLEQDHARKADERAAQTVEQGGRVAEEERGEQNARERKRERLRRADEIERKEGYGVGQPEFNAGDRGEGRL